MRKLTKEIRSYLTCDDDITMNKTAKLPFLAAVIEETLRMYPPVAAGLRRVIPKGGATIDKYFVPEDVSCRTLDLTLFSTCGTDKLDYCCLPSIRIFPLLFQLCRSRRLHPRAMARH